MFSGLHKNWQALMARCKSESPKVAKVTTRQERSPSPERNETSEVIFLLMKSAKNKRKLLEEQCQRARYTVKGCPAEAPCVERHEIQYVSTEITNDRAIEGKNNFHDMFDANGNKIGTPSRNFRAYDRSSSLTRSGDARRHSEEYIFSEKERKELTSNEKDEDDDVFFTNDASPCVRQTSSNFSRLTNNRKRSTSSPLKYPIEKKWRSSLAENIKDSPKRVLSPVRKSSPRTSTPKRNIARSSASDMDRLMEIRTSFLEGKDRRKRGVPVIYDRARPGVKFFSYEGND